MAKKLFKRKSLNECKRVRLTWCVTVSLNLKSDPIYILKILNQIVRRIGFMVVSIGMLSDSIEETKGNPPIYILVILCIKRDSLNLKLQSGERDPSIKNAAIF